MTKAQARYIVMHHDGQWKINLDNRYYGPCTSREAAVDMAIDTARKAVSGGYAASVLVMEGGQFERVWSSEEEARGTVG